MPKLVVKEFLNVEDTRSILRKDINRYTTENSKEFLSKNLGQAYVLVNTWINMFPIDMQSDLVEYICQFGLYKSIFKAQVSANEVVHDDYISDEVFSSLQVILENDIVRILEILRMPKRFTFTACDKLSQASMKDFLTVNNRMKQLDLNTPFTKSSLGRVYSSHVHKLMCLNAQDIVTKNLCKRIANVRRAYPNFDDGGKLSEGTSSHTGKQKSCKLLELSQYYHEFFAPYHINNLSPYDENLTYVSKKYVDVYGTCVPIWVLQNHCVEPNCVPKSYNTYRIIAKEPTPWLWMSNRILEVVDGYIRNGRLRSYIFHYDQSLQQDMVRRATAEGLATIDLSHASDTVRKTFVAEFFPEYYTLTKDCIPSHFVVNGKTSYLRMYSTAGNPLTYVTECFVFLLFCWTACDLAQEPSLKKLCTVVGDDIIVPNNIAQTLIELLQLYGFEPNVSKSYFNDESFRESCGADYYEGMYVTSTYWPRHYVPFFTNGKKLIPTQDNQEEILGLVQLQRYLYCNLYKDAANFLRNAICVYTNNRIAICEPFCAGVPLFDDCLFGPIPTYGMFFDYIDSSTGTYKAIHMGDDDFTSYEKAYKMFRDGNIQKNIYFVVPKLTNRMKERRACSCDICSCANNHILVNANELSINIDLAYARRKEVTELFLYLSFLKNGPKFDDPLSELLGNTSTPPSFMQLDGTPTLGWNAFVETLM